MEISTDELPAPFIAIPGLANIRDIGGWPIVDQDGKPISTVRKRVLYRGPDPAPITAAGQAKLVEFGITTVFDLRSKPQVEKAGGVKELDGIQRRWRPIFSPANSSRERAAARYQQYASDGTEGIVLAFTEILVEGGHQFRNILLDIATLPLSQDSTTVSSPAYLIHCTTGNNRTGVFIGIILSLLHVPDAQVAAEYALTQRGLASTRDMVVDRLMKNPIFAHAGGGGRARAERMVGAREESMMAMLEMVRRKWGTAEGYVKEVCGLTDEEVERVRRVLTGPDVV